MHAIAVVVVNVSNTNITASTSADLTSPPGDYPITLQGCNNYNPNYNVVLHDGTLTVGYSCTITRRMYGKAMETLMMNPEQQMGHLLVALLLPERGISGLTVSHLMEAVILIQEQRVRFLAQAISLSAHG